MLEWLQCRPMVMVKGLAHPLCEVRQGEVGCSTWSDGWGDHIHVR